MEKIVAEGAGWLAIICQIVAVLGCAYALAATGIAARFGRTASMPATSYPAITILKPLHGAEPQLYNNLSRFCAQDYPSPVQIVFGVADPADPAIATVRELIAAFPDCDVRLVVCPRQHGANRKVSNLINMAAEARHDVLVISDSDIVIERNYLERIAASLGHPGVGLVTLLYCGLADTGPWPALAAAAVDYHFLPNALLGLRLGLARPCFGSTIAIRRQTLAAIGGLAAVADDLADDYALGALVRGAGLTVAIPQWTVAHLCSEQSLRELLAHELRWARTIRGVDPAGYAGLFVTHPLPFALLGAMLSGFTVASIAILAAALACRFVLQWQIDRGFHARRAFFWCGPLRDLLSFVVFVGSFFGRTVEWRGHHYGLQSATKIEVADKG